MDARYTGEKISALRREKGLTQRELAERLNVTDKAVSKWETGKNFPDLALLQPLAETLDTTVSALLGAEEPIAEETIAVLSAISQQEKKSIKWSLYEFLTLTAVVSLFSVIKANQLRSWWLLCGNLYVFFSSLFLGGMLARKFSSQSEYRWPDNRDAELYSNVKISLSLWGEKLRRK